jgi:hypothetical protein
VKQFIDQVTTFRDIPATTVDLVAEAREAQDEAIRALIEAEPQRHS